MFYVHVTKHDCSFCCAIRRGKQHLLPRRHGDGKADVPDEMTRPNEERVAPPSESCGCIHCVLSTLIIVVGAFMSI
jgi:hypothetical protein